jgi:lipid A 3-O-deacylase
MARHARPVYGTVHGALDCPRSERPQPLGSQPHPRIAGAARTTSQSSGCRQRRRGVPWFTAAIVAAAGSTASAQATGAVQLRADNDGFNFWQRPWNRPDGEYTNGVRLTMDVGRTPRWWRLGKSTPPCADAPDAVPRCSSVQLAFGQDMYTPAEDSQPFTYDGWRRQRPYAGWLYGNMNLRTAGRSTMRSFGLTLGVTGPPSLADQAQRKAHELMSRYTSVPVGWDTQVRFEPGVIVDARQRWLLFSGTVRGVRLVDAVVGVGASLGNVLTNAEAGADLRMGINMSHPWRRTRNRGPVEILGVIGVRGQAIAHSIFLDGNTLNPDRRVTRIPGVADVHASAGFRLGPLVIAYAVTRRSQEYTTGPRSHAFGSLVAGIGGTPDITAP